MTLLLTLVQTLSMGAVASAALSTIFLPVTIRSFTGGGPVCNDTYGVGPCPLFVSRPNVVCVVIPGYGFTPTTEVPSVCPEIRPTVAPYNGRIVNHPDFQANYGLYQNVVQNTLGTDRKPVFGGSGAATAVAAGVFSSYYDFLEWHRDSYRNKRIDNIPIQLTQQAVNSTLYSVDVPFYFPLNQFVPQAGSYDSDPNYNAPIWPLAPYEDINGPCALDAVAKNQECAPNQYSNLGSKYSMSVEHHSFFRYQGNEIFNFAGDDDVWVFIDDILAIDIGGIHGSTSQNIQLNTSALFTHLTVGSIYSFDYFYHERHTILSDFTITTSITPFCSVSDLALVVFQSTNLQQSAASGSLIVNGASKGADTQNFHFQEAPGLMLITQKFQLQAGFILNFGLTISGGVTTSPGSFSVHLKPTPAAMSKFVSIDFFSSGVVQATLPTSGKKVTSKLYLWLQNLFDGTPHNIKVLYYSVPTWLEVYADDMVNPVLIIKNTDVAYEIGTTGYGFMELAFNNNPYSPSWSDLEVSSVVVQLTTVDNTKTVLATTPPSSVPAGQPYQIKVQGYDKCGNAMQSGGFSSQLVGSILQNGNPAPATILDNEDGTYTYSFLLNKTGTYTPQVSYLVQNTPTPLPQVMLLPFKVTLGPLNGANAIITAPNNTLGGALNVALSFTIVVQDIYGNYPDATSGPGLLSAQIVDGVSGMPSTTATISIAYKSAINGFLVTYKATTASVYAIKITGGSGSNTAIVSPLFNGVVIGTPQNSGVNPVQTENVINVKAAIPIIVVLACLIPILIYGAWRLHRYRQKWLERKNKHLPGHVDYETGIEAQTFNPIFKKGAPGDRFALQNHIKRYEHAMVEIDNLKTKQETSHSDLAALDWELKNLDY